MMAAKIFLRKKISDRIALGHPWVFANEIGFVEGFQQLGEIGTVFSANGSFVGKGYYNPDSKIAFRFLCRQKELEINRDFFLQQLKKAIHFRSDLTGANAFIRLVVGEADFLPGLIVDKIQDYIVFQIYTLGMALWQETIVSCLLELFPDCFLYEKNDGRYRAAEGLANCRRFWSKEGATVFPFQDSGITVTVDLEKAPRTGLYWEQIYINKIIAPFVAGKKILDAFCYDGLIALASLKNGAVEAFGIDWSDEAVRKAEENAKQNRLTGKVKFLTGNSFLELQKLVGKRHYFDLIILDPPALYGIRKQPEKALSGYAKIVEAALDLLTSAGFLLLTMSGTMLSEDLLLKQIHQSAKRKNKFWRIVQRIDQPADHPVLWQVPVTRYFSAWLLHFSDD